jgi:hypothetical protein
MAEDAQTIRDTLRRFGVADDEEAAYLAHPYVWATTPLPLGAMDAPIFLETLARLEGTLAQAEADYAHAQGHHQIALRYVAEGGLAMNQFVMAHREALLARVVKQRNELGLFVMRYRPIDARAFEAAMTPLLRARMHATLTLKKAEAQRIVSALTKEDTVSIRA